MCSGVLGFRVNFQISAWSSSFWAQGLGLGVEPGLPQSPRVICSAGKVFLEPICTPQVAPNLKKGSIQVLKEARKSVLKSGLSYTLAFGVI